MDQFVNVASKPSQGNATSSPAGQPKTSARPVAGTRPRGDSPTFACSDHWRELVKLIWSEYAFSTMYGVNVVNGTIISYNNVQRNFTFSPGGGEKPQEPTFDDYWRALQALCLRLGTGRLAEVKFVSGRPIAARTDEGGRRLKRLARQSGDR